MNTHSKAGKVLNKENVNRLKAAIKHTDKAMELHKAAEAHFSKCAEHMKKIMASHVAAATEDESGDAGSSDDDAGSKGGENGENKDVAEPVTDEGEGAGNQTPVGVAHPPIPDAEDYYQQYAGKKNASQATGGAAPAGDLLARAKAAIRQTTVGATAPVVEEAPYTDHEVAVAMSKAIDEIYTQHIRGLRGQD